MVSQQPGKHLPLLFRPKMNFNKTWGPIHKKKIIPRFITPLCTWSDWWHYLKRHCLRFPTSNSYIYKNINSKLAWVNKTFKFLFWLDKDTAYNILYLANFFHFSRYSQLFFIILFRYILFNFNWTLILLQTLQKIVIYVHRYIHAQIHT